MEHIDALEAVRRLTLERDVLLSVVIERDALAEQVKLLKEQNAPQAPERRERHETDAETGEGGNGAPQTCERCKHAVPGAHAMLCTHHSPHTTGQHGERGQWPVVLMTDRCGDWEGK